MQIIDSFQPTCFRNLRTFLYTLGVLLGKSGTSFVTRDICEDVRLSKNAWARVTQSMFKHPQDPRYRVTRFRWRYLRQPPGARIHGIAERGASGARHDESTPRTSIGAVLRALISPLSVPEVDHKQKNTIKIVRRIRDSSFTESIL